MAAAKPQKPQKPQKRQKPPPAQKPAPTAGGRQKRSEEPQKLHPIAAARLTNRRR